MARRIRKSAGARARKGQARLSRKQKAAGILITALTIASNVHSGLSASKKIFSAGRGLFKAGSSAYKAGRALTRAGRAAKAFRGTLHVVQKLR